MEDDLVTWSLQVPLASGISVERVEGEEMETPTIENFFTKVCCEGKGEKEGDTHTKRHRD